MSNILIVEDEPHLATGLKFNLESDGYQVQVVDTAEKAQEIYQNFDLLLLDIMLPGMSGITLLEHIRQKDYRKPVLILSAKSAEEDLIAGLSAGADDYVTKPFSLKELLLRIKRILERYDWQQKNHAIQKRFHFGDFWIDFDTLEAKSNVGVHSITQYECLVLQHLIVNAHRAVSREELLKEVWGYEHTPETRTVDIFIARLRKMFEKDSKAPQFIKSVRGVGYRFIV